MRRAVEQLAVWSALAGGGVLLLLVGLTCVSIAGRALSGAGLGPVPGDYELVEIGIGFAVFAALPWCHLHRGHATVDLLAPLFGDRLNRWLDAVADLAVLAVAAVLAWRLALGMLDKKSYFETTFILGIEVWQGYALGLAGTAVLLVVAVWRAGESVTALTGRRP